jgi:hypothetical protein
MTFEEIMLGGFEGVQQMIANRMDETLQLEFKSKANSEDLDLHKDDRRALGEALSGFANAVGGVLLVGIETARHDGLDRAEKSKPIQKVKQVADRYRSYINECIAPPIAGIRVDALFGEDGAGFLVIEVPRGNARPHMSMAPSHQRYYRRVADRFVPMQHYEIDEMMRLKTHPKLAFFHRVQDNGSIGNTRNFIIPFGLKNVSNVTAKFPYIAYKGGHNLPRVARYGLDGNGRTLWPNLSIGAQGDTVFAAGADQVLHPGQQFDVSMLEFDDVFSQHSTRGWALSNLEEGADLVLNFEFGCEDCPKEVFQVVLSKEEILRP